MKKELGKMHGLVSSARGQNFQRCSVAGDGDCGYSAFGIKRSRAVALLQANIKSNAIQMLLKNVISELLCTEKAFIDYIIKNEYIKDKKIEVQFQTDLEIYQTASDNRSEAVKIENILEKHAVNPEVIKAYINYDVRDRKIQGGWSHPSVLQALAHIRKLNLYLWEQPDDKLSSKLVQHTMYHAYNPEGAKDKDRVDLLFVNGNHFDKLILQTVIKQDQPPKPTKGEIDLSQRSPSLKLTIKQQQKWWIAKYLAKKQANKKMDIQWFYMDYKGEDLLPFVKGIVESGEVRKNAQTAWKELINFHLFHLQFYKYRLLLPMVQYLVEKGAVGNDTRAISKALVTICYVHSLYKGKDLVPVVMYLVEQGAELNFREHYPGFTALELLCRNYTGDNLLSIVKYLVGKGADVKTKASDNSTALIKLCGNSRYVNKGADLLPIIKYLVKAGVDVKAQEKSKNYRPWPEPQGERTALIALCANYSRNEGLLPIVTYLVEQGAYVKAKDQSHTTALRYMFEFYHGKDFLSVAKYLVDKGGTMPVIVGMGGLFDNRSNRSALMTVGQLRVVQWLLKENKKLFPETVYDPPDVYSVGGNMNENESRWLEKHPDIAIFLKCYASLHGVNFHGKSVPSFEKIIPELRNFKGEQKTELLTVVDELLRETNNEQYLAELAEITTENVRNDMLGFERLCADQSQEVNKDSVIKEKNVGESDLLPEQKIMKIISDVGRDYQEQTTQPVEKQRGIISEREKDLMNGYQRKMDEFKKGLKKAHESIDELKQDKNQLESHANRLKELEASKRNYAEMLKDNAEEYAAKMRMLSFRKHLLHSGQPEQVRLFFRELKRYLVYAFLSAGLIGDSKFVKRSDYRVIDKLKKFLQSIAKTAHVVGGLVKLIGTEPVKLAYEGLKLLYEITEVVSGIEEVKETTMELTETESKSQYFKGEKEKLHNVSELLAGELFTLEGLERLAEELAVQITLKYQRQIALLSHHGVKELAMCAMGRVMLFLKEGGMSHGEAIVPTILLYIGHSNLKQKGVFSEKKVQLNKSAAKSFGAETCTEADIFYRTGIQVVVNVPGYKWKHGQAQQIMEQCRLCYGRTDKSGRIDKNRTKIYNDLGYRNGTRTEVECYGMTPVSQVTVPQQVPLLESSVTKLSRAGHVQLTDVSKHTERLEARVELNNKTQLAEIARLKANNQSLKTTVKVLTDKVNDLTKERSSTRKERLLMKIEFSVLKEVVLSLQEKSVPSPSQHSSLSGNRNNFHKEQINKASSGNIGLQNRDSGRSSKPSESDQERVAVPAQ